MLINELTLYLHTQNKYMYAIVEISGKQFKVEKKQKIFVNKLDVAEGKKVSFDSVLMINDGSKSSIGTPKVSGAQVDAKVLKHLKSDKVTKSFTSLFLSVEFFLLTVLEAVSFLVEVFFWVPPVRISLISISVIAWRCPFLTL